MCRSCCRNSYGGKRLFFIIVCRLLCAWYCIVVAATHLSLQSNRIASSTLKLYETTFSGCVFFCLLLCHIKGLVNICRCWKRSSRKTSISRSNSSAILKMYDMVFAPDGKFSRRGEQYELRLLLRELVEIPSQSYQCYLMSHRVANPVFPVLYAIVIAFDSFLVPILMQLDGVEALTRRNNVLLVDIVVDVTLGAILPSLLLVVPTIKIMIDPFVINDVAWAFEVLGAMRHLLITSFLDLVFSAAPLLFSHLLLETIHNNWLDIERAIQSHPKLRHSSRSIQDSELSKIINRTKAERPKKEQPRWRKALDKIFTILSISWGFIIAIVGVRSLFMSNCNDSEMYRGVCELEIYPWSMEPTCGCLSVWIQCHTNPSLRDLNGSEMYQFVENLGNTPLAKYPYGVRIQHCPLTVLPETMVNFQDSISISSNGSPIKRVDIPFDAMPELMYILVQGGSISTIPPQLEHCTSNLYSISFEGCPIVELPDWISTAWSSVRVLKLNNMMFQTFPKSITELTSLDVLWMDNSTEIEEIPVEIGKLINLIEFRLSGSKITTIPQEMYQLTKLTMMSIGGNKLHGPLPWSEEEIIQNWNTSPLNSFFLRGNPICETNPVLKQSKACTQGCSELCDDAFISSNLVCDQVCNVTECSYDSEICLPHKSV